MSDEVSMPKMKWNAKVGSEGGPLLVANVDDFADWTGADPIPGSSLRVWYYGPAVQLLPEDLTPSGPGVWHQIAEFDGADAVDEYVARIREVLNDAVDGIEERTQHAASPEELRRKAQAAMSGAPGAMDEWLSTWRDHMEQGIDFVADGQTSLHLQAEPYTAYAHACDELDGDDVVLLQRPTGSALVWELEGSGIGEVAYAPGGSELLLYRGWVDDSEGDREAKRHALESSVEDEFDTGLVFDLRAKELAVAWSPITARDVVGDEVRDEEIESTLRAAANLRGGASLHQPGIKGVGHLLTLSPGLYRVLTGEHEADDWSARWCRLVRTSGS